MNLPTFDKWLANMGEERLSQEISEGQRSSRAIWERRKHEGTIYSWPAWELRLSLFWEENTEEWHARWVRCGGTLYERRMIATKWDDIWDRLSGTFYDGLGNPYPPYARSSCARWFEIDRGEAIVLGVIDKSEGEAAENIRLLGEMFYDPAKVTLGDLAAKKAGILSALAKLEEEGDGVFPKSQPQRQQVEQAKEECEFRNQQANAKWAEKNAMFRLLEEVECSLREAPVVHDERRWNWLCDSLTKLTATQHFDEYQNWRARAWAASATMYGSLSMPSDELACLKRALDLDPQLAVKRRIKALDRLVNRSDASCSHK